MNPFDLIGCQAANIFLFLVFEFIKGINSIPDSWLHKFRGYMFSLMIPNLVKVKSFQIPERYKLLYNKLIEEYEGVQYAW